MPQSNRKESAECNCKIAEAAKNDEGFFKKLFSKTESNEVAASFDNSASIQDIVPDNYKQAYDVKSVIAAFASYRVSLRDEVKLRIDSHQVVAPALRSPI